MNFLQFSDLVNPNYRFNTGLRFSDNHAPITTRSKNVVMIT